MEKDLKQIIKKNFEKINNEEDLFDFIKQYNEHQKLQKEKQEKEWIFDINDEINNEEEKINEEQLQKEKQELEKLQKETQELENKKKQIKEEIIAEEQINNFKQQYNKTEEQLKIDTKRFKG